MTRARVLTSSPPGDDIIGLLSKSDDVMSAKLLSAQDEVIVSEFDIS